MSNKNFARFFSLEMILPIATAAWFFAVQPLFLQGRAIFESFDDIAYYFLFITTLHLINTYFFIPHLHGDNNRKFEKVAAIIFPFLNAFFTIMLAVMAITNILAIRIENIHPYIMILICLSPIYPVFIAPTQDRELGTRERWLTRLLSIPLMAFATQVFFEVVLWAWRDTTTLVGQIVSAIVVFPLYYILLIFLLESVLQNQFAFKHWLQKFLLFVGMFLVYLLLP